MRPEWVRFLFRRGRYQRRKEKAISWKSLKVEDLSAEKTVKERERKNNTMRKERSHRGRAQTSRWWKKDV